MKKLFVVTPNNIINSYNYPWFYWGNSIEEVEAQFEDCTVEEDI
jgi:hypothetical protein